jgi:UDP-N-acetyl-D-glucosamine dehydrogenase
VSFHDAHTEGSGEPLESVTLTDDELQGSDCVVIVTDHSQTDYQRVCQLATLIVDTRNALNGDVRKTSSARIIRL